MNGVQHKIVGTGAAIATAYAAMKLTGDQTATVCLVTGIFGSILPDIDHDMTKLGRKRKLVTTLSKNLLTAIYIVGVLGIAIILGTTILGIQSYNIDTSQLMIMFGAFIVFGFLYKFLKNNQTIKWATKHRGLMHTLVVPALLCFAIYVIKIPVYRWALIGTVAGYLSHLIADMMTVEGCPILFPLTKNCCHILRLSSKSKALTGVAFLLGGLFPIITFVYFNF